MDRWNPYGRPFSDLYSDGDEEAVMFCSRRGRSARNKKHGGSRPGKAPNKKRDFQARWTRFQQLYFDPHSVYSSEMFRRRFRMRQPLFERIANGVCGHDAYFQQRSDCSAFIHG